jgi:hypothetical protein
MTLGLVLVLAGAVAVTVLYYARLDQHGLAGPAIVGLCFSGIAIFGIYAQLSWDMDQDTPNRIIVRQFATYVIQMLIFIPSFVGGMWLLFRLFEILSPVLPDGIAGLAVVIAFTWYIWGVIRILTWLSDRGIIGGGLNRNSE